MKTVQALQQNSRSLHRLHICRLLAENDYTCLHAHL
jgi:hypothetical protein